jgi:hypothetical protein
VRFYQTAGLTVIEARGAGNPTADLVIEITGFVSLTPASFEL